MTEQRDAWWTGLPPATGAAVMATGTLSVGLRLTGFAALSSVALGLATALWLLLAGSFTAQLLRHRDHWKSQTRTPPALTAVAATTVLGVRYAALGATPLAAALLLVAALLWPGLLGSVLRHLTRRAPGSAFLICVATQGLVVLAAVLTPAVGNWLARPALVAFVLGLVLYAGALARFDLRQIVTGAGDHWVAGGALSISTLAASQLVATRVWSDGTAAALRTADSVLLTLALAWYAVLLCAEAVRPRPAYDVRRWSTVFPLAMTAMATLTAPATATRPWLNVLGHVLLWVAAAAWLPAAYGLIRTLGTGCPTGRQRPSRSAG
ncbi:tellurite resistance/C4-dicarboxylate transporter family protein [Streptomyces sp. BBFR2]|uniref:tellurite resistance/C4-dicarboxylate transporter family protein n=1 Tax=Streptomyces sp. BBFR2 TaxID=3372854 RepID=UPI0037DA5DEF